MREELLQVPEFFNRIARRQAAGMRIIPVLIETHGHEVKWGISITSHNPDPDDYYSCHSLQEAQNLKTQIEQTNPAVPPGGQP